MITEKQYLKAKQIIKDYERQLRQYRVSRSFSADDLVIMSYSIQVPSLTMKEVDEDFASTLQDKITEQGFSVDFVSLDDFGHISVAFRRQEIEERHIEAVLKALNDG